MTDSFKISRLFLGVAPALACACVPPGDGVPPPEDEIYFPVGLSVSEDGEHLFVINSNFDLKYAQGTVQSLRLHRLRELSKRPCSTDSDCVDGGVCDTEPSDANGNAPSFFCVDPGDGRPCGELKEKTPEELALSPGRCGHIDLDEPPDGGDDLLEDVAETSAFATQGLLLSRPCQSGEQFVPCSVDASDAERVQQREGDSLPERLFVPVRGDTTVHYLDITGDGHFVCGRPIESSGASFRSDDSEEGLRCSTSYRIANGTTFGLSEDGELVTTSEPPDPDEVEEGDKKDDPEDLFRLPPEPLDLAASQDGRVIVVSHQLDGRASTLINSWVGSPELVHILSGLEESPIGVAALPRAPEDPFFDFYLTYRSDAEVELLRFSDDGLLQASSPAGATEEQLALGETTFRPELSVLATSPITLNSAGYDSRGMLVDSSAREAAVLACGGDATCIDAASEVPLDVYVANRSPNSLLVGRTSGADLDARVSSLPEFHKTVPLTAGPSRVVRGPVTTQSGDQEMRIFVICFDSALIYVYDPVRGRIESQIRTGRGPYSMAFDPEQPLAFVGHFTDSHFGVVSLDQRHPVTYGATLATFGDPTPPRAAK